MNRGLIELGQFGEPGGIDQSNNPAPNTVRDARNLDSSGSYWKLRPAWRFLSALKTTPIDISSPFTFCAEIIPDKRYLLAGRGKERFK